MPSLMSLIRRSIKPLAELEQTVDPASGATRGRLSDYDLNTWPELAPALTPAAVLVPLVAHPGGFTVLLTKRTEHLNDHAGQISFPGGRAEAQDSGPVATALREAQEEIGLAPQFVEAVGYLDSYETVTRFLVTPVVGFVQPGLELRPDRFEVADVFEVPLQYLLDPANQQIHTRNMRGRPRSYYVFEYEDRYIWGATAGMLMNLSRRIRAAGESET